MAAIFLPRRRRMRSGGRSSIRLPSNRTSPPPMRPGRSSSPMIAVPVSDFPAPDSPTTPSISPAATLNDTWSTAVSLPRRVSKTTLRSRTSSSGAE